MCGIAGFVGTGSRETLEDMGATLLHRGPDDAGVLLSGTVGFAFRRLAIIDLSPAGHQPMESVSGNTSIVFNGEIYNFGELRAELVASGYHFKSHSDTEVILALYEREGTDAFKKLRGMFAIALHDRLTGAVYLVRDRMGEKPLYYGVFGETLIFGSELKALMKHPLWQGTIDRTSLALYLIHEHVPTPRSIWEGVKKLEPGSFVRFQKGKLDAPHAFWHPVAGADTQPGADFTESVHTLDDLLLKSVREELHADVPVGVLLSGGLDSSIIAYYAKETGKTVKTFSIGFDDPSYDESAHARSVASALGTEHHERMFTSSECLTQIKETFAGLDEPLADASILPTQLLSSFVREQVTVAVGGDGGDELFAGYPTFRAEELTSFYLLIPEFLRTYLIEPMVRMLPVSESYMSFGFKAKRFVSGAHLPAQVRHLAWLSAFAPSELKTLMPHTPITSWEEAVPALVEGLAKNGDDKNFHNEVLVQYQRTYLIDQVLVKVDRASMACSLEVRAPFLDVRIVELLNGLPYDCKWKGRGKRILKTLMEHRLPKGIAGREKKGFGLPLARWLRTDLRPLAEELLAPRNVQATGLLNAEEVTRLLSEHLARTADHTKKLWTLMVFMLWYEAWGSKNGTIGHT